MAITLSRCIHVYCQPTSSSIPSITQKADSLYQAGDLKACASLAEVALLMHKDDHDTTSLSYANTLRIMGQAHYRLSNFKAAIECLNKSLYIFETYNTDKQSYARAMITLSNCLAETNDYEGAIALGNKAIQYVQKQVGHDSVLYAEILAEHGYNLMYSGDFINSKDLCENAVRLYQSIPDTNSLGYARALAYYAESISNFGDYDLAIELNKEALLVTQNNGYENHPDNALIINNQGYYYTVYGDFVSSLPYIESATCLRKTTLGQDHPEYSFSLSNLAVAYQCTGDYEHALENALQSLYVAEVSDGKESLTYALSLRALSGIYNSIGDLDSGLKAASESMNIIKSIYGTNHYEYIYALIDVAECYDESKQYEKAIECLTLALEVLTVEYDLENETAAYVYELLSDEYCSIGNYSKALHYIEISLKIKSSILGQSSEKYLHSLSSLINIKHKVGICDVKSITKYTYTLGDIVKKAFSNLTSYRRKLLWSNYKEWFVDYLPTYVNKHKNDSLNAVLFDASLLSKGILLSTEQELSTLISSRGDKLLNEIYEDYRQTNMLLNVLENSPFEEHFLNIDSLKYRISDLETILMSRSKEFGDFTSNFNIRWKDIKGKLTSNSIAIEFVEYTNENDEKAYCALTLKSGYEYPHLIQLCTEKEIKRISPKLYYLSLDLSDLLFSKLETELSGVKKVYFAPAGIFYNIAIESLPFKNLNKRFGDKYQTFRLSSTRELVRTKNNSRTHISSAIYGGIKYDDQLNAHIELDTLRAGFSYLPESLEEANVVAEILQSGNNFVQLFTGLNGTESSVKSISGSLLSHLHIATHGFYVNDNEVSIYAKSFPTLALNITDDIEELSMQRSGLLFSGANITCTKELYNDGILTSAEISNLNLTNINLVVLSACQTGLGEISTEGVWGLQRGFKKAGVGSIIMSLWNVNDYSTRIMMEAFYRALNSGKSIVDSFNVAINKVRRFKGKIDIDGQKTKVCFSDPQYWAPFILLDCVE